MKKPFALAMLISVLAGPAGADVAAGRSAFEAGDLRTAEALLRPAAETGDAEAALLLGRMAEDGTVVAAGDSEAWRWYKRAADAGQVEAMVRAADFVWAGRGTVMDRRQAYALFKRAAEAGNARARGRIGEMALSGLGRPVNAVEGLAWLVQAAAADDPEALFLLDGLAAQGRAETPPAGSSTPVDAFAQRMLEEARAALAAINVDGEVTALLRADGSVRLTLSRLSMAAPDWDLGTIRVLCRAAGDGEAEIELLIPSRLRLGDAVLSLSGQRLRGRWSLRSHGPVSLKAEAVAGGLDYGALWSLAFQSLAAERQAGRTVIEKLAASHLTLRGDIGGRRLQAAADRLRGRGEWRPATAGSAWPELGGVIRALFGLALGDGAVPRPAEASGDIALEEVRVEQDAVPLMAARSLESGLALADLDKPMALGHWSYSHDGWVADGRWSAPERLTAGISGEHLPLSALLRLAGGDWSVAALADLAVSLSAAGSRVSLDELAAFGRRWSLAAVGRAVPANGGLTQAADVTVADLEAMLAASPRFDPATGQLLRQVGRPGTDSKNRPVTRFQLVLPPGGGALVNGKALGDQVLP
ncbi:MAG TPA: sel1 repeat family protein [Rhodospirillaceae bacterium]|nr:sel1 repeat family protein [Rhodospirillaceae bacterium]